jgi:signal peptidase I
MNKPKSPAEKSAEKSGASAHQQSNSARGTRETIESIVIAIVLAFLFRAFEAEAFVIPTGSMAPTLQGQHVDLECPKCKYWYRTGASGEQIGTVSSTTCPICGYRRDFKWNAVVGKYDSDQSTFTGDRILVSKFAYDLPGASPRRWDVIVFKYPGNAKQNYIKRLIGLPGEKILIRHGNIYVTHKDDGPNADPQIARKTEHSPAKLKAMLQVVDDTDFIPAELAAAGWPSRWQQVPVEAAAHWRVGGDDGLFESDGKPGETWLRYSHVVPDDAVWLDLADWQSIGKIDAVDGDQAAVVRRMMNVEAPFDHGEESDVLQVRELLAALDANDNGIFDPDEKKTALLHHRRGELIRDSYAYNSANGALSGTYWVGDLALECELDVKGAQGQVLLKLVRGGAHYDCRIDVKTGTATLSIDSGSGTFTGRDEAAGKEVSFKQPRSADCGLRGAGRYQIRFSNVDNELMLWVNDQPATFDGPTTYADSGPVQESTTTPDDFLPVGVGSDGAALSISRLKVLRDVYYVAVSNFGKGERNHGSDAPEGVELPFDELPNTGGFLGHDQYLPLGDNSPASLDSRLWRAADAEKGRTWTIPTSVSREMLLGKALFIYWPHAWHGVVPNFGRMGFIR